MVGLTVVLEVQNTSNFNKAASTLIIHKLPSPNSFKTTRSWTLQVAAKSYANGFLHECFLCSRKLLPGNDVYMYKGDRAFCSEECRYRQIFMDEKENSSHDLAY